MASAATGAGAAEPPQGRQGNGQFAASYGAAGVSSVPATAQKVSCYAPELTYFAALAPADGYVDGGMTACGSATTGEELGPYATQDVANPPMRVKDHSESDIRVDPANPQHLIGQSKWILSAEGYNHQLGFFESFDGGRSFPVQGHVPGYEGWVDATDPIGAFDPWGNFYSLLLPYQFYYDKSGGHKYDNGSNQTNPALPPEAIAMAVHPHTTIAGKTPAASWITTHGGHPDYLMTTSKANTSEPDKQWLTIDTNPGSPHFGRVYAMWTVFVLNPAVIFESHADANPDGTHSDWTAPQILPTVNGKRWDTYMLPHVTPDGTVWTTTTSNPHQQNFSSADISLVWSRDGGETWQGPLPVAANISVPSYQNTSFREGILNSFATGMARINGHYPLYVSYEDGSEGRSNIYLTASFDSGGSWTAPVLVNDNDRTTDTLQPNLHVAPNGTVAVAFYDRRLACPDQGFEFGRIARQRRGGGIGHRLRSGDIRFARRALGPQQLLRQRGDPVLPAGPDADRPQYPAVAQQLGSAAVGAASWLDSVFDHLHRRLFRRRLGRGLHLHHIHLDLQCRWREPRLPPAAVGGEDQDTLGRRRPRRW
jgi:hypothetical protein